MFANPKKKAPLGQSARKRLLGLVVAVLAPATLPAAQVYVDATAGAGGNTYNNADNSLTGWYVRNSSAINNDNL